MCDNHEQLIKMREFISKTIGHSETIGQTISIREGEPNATLYLTLFSNI